MDDAASKFLPSGSPPILDECPRAVVFRSSVVSKDEAGGAISISNELRYPRHTRNISFPLAVAAQVNSRIHVSRGVKVDLSVRPT